MKKLNVKGLMIVVLFVSGLLAAPTFAMGQEEDDTIEEDPAAGAGMYDAFTGGFGNMFNTLGYGGNLIGKVFQTLFMQGLTLEEQETLDNVFVLSANETQTQNGTIDFEDGESDRFYLPQNDEYNTTALDDQPYCNVTRKGKANYTLTQGVGITLIIWDNDRSFIDAAQKVIDLINKVREAEMNNESVDQEVMEEAASTLSWFLIHINDIFTGDELFVLNPITWQNLELEPYDNYNVNRTWHYGNGSVIDDDDELLESWRETANETKDSRMQWLLKPNYNEGEIKETIWTQFTFDLIQLWIKNFEIHIDVSAFLDGEDMNPADAFSGCDIEFFLFSHHLSGAFLYNDSNGDSVVSVDDYENVTYTDDGENKTGQIPTTSEITHRLMLGGVEEFVFQKPRIEDNSISWGLTLDQVNISAIPLGIDLNSYMGSEPNELDFMYFGFKFEPKMDNVITGTDGTEMQAARGDVKVEHNFGPWKNMSNSTENNIEGLDMTILYTSTVLHFHLNVENTAADPEDPQALLGQEDYNNETKELQIGNYLSDEVEANLDFVDIAGPKYTMSDSSDSDNSPGDESTDYDATTNTIPVALWTSEQEAHKTYTGENDTVEDDFASDVRVSAEFQVLVYAVCYPDFGENTGMGIWHDPTFSVYMVFEAKGFWALILLVAGIGLVGVATIFIKKRKDARI
ncbi:MAG: hypothetical protein R6U96_18315 [Promethearchaeia archaeon]